MFLRSLQAPSQQVARVDRLLAHADQRDLCSLKSALGWSEIQVLVSRIDFADADQQKIANKIMSTTRISDHTSALLILILSSL